MKLRFVFTAIVTTQLLVAVSVLDSIPSEGDLLLIQHSVQKQQDMNDAFHSVELDDCIDEVHILPKEILPENPNEMVLEMMCTDVRHSAKISISNISNVLLDCKCKQYENM